MIEALLLLLVGTVVILVIIAACGYFVAQEFAYMSVDRTRLAAQAAGGDASAQRALMVTQRTSFMLSGAQLGITVTGLLIGFVAQPMIGYPLGVVLGGLGVPGAVGIGIGTALALIVATLVTMIFAELYPKNLAIANPEPLARGLARSTLIYLKIFGWLIGFFDKSANILLRALRIEPVHDLDVTASAADLPHIIADSRESGDLPLELSLMMDRIIDFPQQDVEHAMVPRSQVDWVTPYTTLAELRVLMSQAHTRYPVIDDEDTPVGVVHLADLLSQDVTDPAEATVTTLMRPATVIPTLMRLPDALALLAASRNQLACVIDEYGGFAGVLTLEDLAMEVVGEITDEHDESPSDGLTAEGENVWLIDGDVHLDELRRKIGRDLPDPDVETVAGLLIAQRGGLPQLGERIVVPLPIDPANLVNERPSQWLLEVDVLQVERHIPTELRVKLVEVSKDEDEA